MVHESLDISKVHNILDKEEAIEAVWGRLGVDQTLGGCACFCACVCVCSYLSVSACIFVCMCIIVFVCVFVK